MTKQLISKKRLDMIMDLVVEEKLKNTQNGRTAPITISVKIGKQIVEQCLFCMCLCTASGVCACVRGLK